VKLAYAISKLQTAPEGPMTALLTPQELAMFDHAPEDDLVDLAIELDVVVPDDIVRAQFLNAVVRNLRDLAAREGLPLSPYDAEDLQDLPPEHLDALARLCSLTPGKKAETIELLLKAGKKVYKVYRKQRSRSQVPMYLPMLLSPLARLASTWTEDD
jgi:hypothetical protein